MRKIFLSGFPEGAERIGTSLSMLSKNGTVTYFLGSDNYFSHKNDDNAARRFALASLMANKHIRATDLEQSSLALPHRTLMNWMAQYRDHGGGSFFPSNQPR